MVFTCTCSNNFKKNFKFPSQVVDRFEKPDIIGGSQRRKPLGANDEAASATTVHYGEAALKKVLTKQISRSIMGGSQRRKRRGTRRKALRPTPKFFDSMRRYLVKAPAGRMYVHLADV
jgi:hypothetical protein